ncbi:helicase conserved C-terminal domain-containing protein [Blyttiomyces helicus]|uniref:Helicase conserved C-terminal domain-containing protein n=1 Tax=Blyttiomyces helicus TaxID=388810 RepID=A0A4P9VZY8_9FUNG|nr:helicase conserved C-terminal domain-containing protein [Blyttiomyces helicus]|eukprot:RKO85399.1 helicase conserved C-terminal domain-containing protein [Blyttiomyces helicus]
MPPVSSPNPVGAAGSAMLALEDGEEKQKEAQVVQHLLVLPKRALLQADDSPAPSDFPDRNIKYDSVSNLFDKDYTFLPLKPEHCSRPLWVCDDGLEVRIMLEAFSPLAGQAQDFLSTIAEPVSRPARMHEFKLTSYSLYAAVAVGMETGTILEVLDRFSKVKPPDRVVNFIRESTMSYGKVKLVLKDNRLVYIELRLGLKVGVGTFAGHISEYSARSYPIFYRYFIESSYPEILRNLLLDTTIARARVIREDEEDTIFSGTRGPKSLPAASSSANGAAPSASAESADPTFSTVITLDRADDAEDRLDEDDFTHSFEIAKTELGEVKRRWIEVDCPLTEEYDFRHDADNPNLDIDLSPTTVIRDYQEKSLSKMFGVEQWANEFRNWSTIKEGQIAKFTADEKKKVHEVFRRVLETVAAHTKLCLTATLVREDDKIENLNYLVGPKLYEAKWMDLAGRGHIAKVEVLLDGSEREDPPC